MIKYTFFQKNPSTHYVYIDMLIDAVNSSNIQLQLPSWRPGRYELANFAKNLKRLDAFNEKGDKLAYQKLNKDLWEINCAGAKSIMVTYSYYSAELNAGACFADDSQIYMNPVHCCFYVVGREHESHQVELQIPETHKIACSLKKEKNCLFAENYNELTESPFIASKNLQTESYEVNGVNFHLHFNGICKPDFAKMKKEFVKFTTYQEQFWGTFPFTEYHFLFQITPYKFYHGVEHFKNTVIALGPGYEINEGKVYENLLGVSCHELFHAWNVKLIRPKEMLPYDLTKENYSESGFVYEGFTTYYGDKNLLSAEVFTEEQYYETLDERLDKHFYNFGRYNLSVAASSFDTWLDGYVPGAPYRKTNIYDEGSLIAFMLDVMIMKATENKYSLKDVCRILYNEFGKKNIGYSKEDIRSLCERVSGIEFKTFFERYVSDSNDYEEALIPCFNYLGLELHKDDTENLTEKDFGFKCVENGSFSKVVLVAPYSPAWQAGLFNADEIIAVNNIVVRNNLNSLLKYNSAETAIDLTIISNECLKTIKLEVDAKGKTWFFKSKIRRLTSIDRRQMDNFKAWKSN